jgi:hypothetical protein
VHHRVAVSFHASGEQLDLVSLRAVLDLPVSISLTCLIRSLDAACRRLGMLVTVEVMKRPVRYAVPHAVLAGALLR